MPTLEHRAATAVIWFVILAWSMACAQTADQKQSASPANNGMVARGKYIVESLSVCSQCHTPRDSAGNYDSERWLQGGEVWLQPPQPNPDWPQRAPRIAGNPPGTDEELITLLTTGIWRDGKRLRPPMPQFRMSREDAQAVIAYLKTLNSKLR
jgi:mono/diheme cytochrome c family protein